MPRKPKLITKARLARNAGRCENTIRRYMNMGTIPSHEEWERWAQDWIDEGIKQRMADLDKVVH